MPADVLPPMPATDIGFIAAWAVINLVVFVGTYGIWGIVTSLEDAAYASTTKSGITMSRDFFNMLFEGFPPVPNLKQLYQSGWLSIVLTVGFAAST